MGGPAWFAKDHFGSQKPKLPQGKAARFIGPRDLSGGDQRQVPKKLRIEEANIPDAFLLHGTYVGHIHFVDSNRSAVRKRLCLASTWLHFQTRFEVTLNLSLRRNKNIVSSDTSR